MILKDCQNCLAYYQVNNVRDSCGEFVRNIDVIVRLTVQYNTLQYRHS